MGVMWVEVPRDVVMVEGPDALSFLHSQLSQDLHPLAVGGAVPSLVLEPTGKVHSLVRVLRSGDHAYVLDIDAGWGEALVERLSRFKIRVKADISTIPWRCLALRGDGAAEHVEAVEGGAVAVPAWWGDGTAVDLLGPAPIAPAGVGQGSPEWLEHARIVAGWPAMGAEITEGTIPAELGVSAVAVSFTKGCYPGQELVERMESRGSSAPRSLRRLPAEDRAPGDPIVVDGADVGRITSVAGDAALGFVKRGVDLGTSVQAPSS